MVLPPELPNSIIWAKKHMELHLQRATYPSDIRSLLALHRTIDCSEQIRASVMMSSEPLEYSLVILALVRVTCCKMQRKKVGR